MTTTLRDTAGAGSNQRYPTTGRGLPALDSALGRIRRRISLLPLLLGLLTVVASVAGVTLLLGDRGTVTTIWVAGRDIDAEVPLDGDALATVEIAGVVGFEHYDVEVMSREALLAAVPRVDVPAGSPLSAGQFHQGPNPVGVAPGALTVAVVIGRAHLPANLERGDTVLLVGVPAASRPEGTAEAWPGTTAVLQEATVVAIEEQTTAPEVTVTVSVPRDVVDDIAWLAGQGRLVMARDR